MQLALTVLSPHRDDSVFSLALSLSRWAEAGVRIRIVNFFTTSSYAPFSSKSSVSEISALRELEDLHALRRVNAGIVVESLDLLDAPIRLNTTISGLSALDNEGLLSSDEIEFLTKRLRRYFSDDLVLAPLSLGNHIDHKVVQFAAFQANKGKRLGFYEDLPYLSWTSEEDLKCRVARAEKAIRLPLRQVTISNPSARGMKLRAVSSYRSQIDRSMAQLITNYSNRYAGGERIWIPRHSSSWNRLCSLGRA